jgi:mono/diheme cytochrome c family protein
MNQVYLPLASVALLLATGGASAQEDGAAKIRPFLQTHCVDCHGPEVKKSGLRLDNLKFDLTAPRVLATWIKAHDKMAHGEMPPKKQPRPPAAELAGVQAWLHAQLQNHSRRTQEKEGRVVLRRLNCNEYDATLHDLLAINTSVKSFLPEDNVAAGFDNVSAALEISAAHLLGYQQAAERAILAAIPVAPRMPFSDKRTGRQMVEKSEALKKQLLGKSLWLKDDALVVHARLADHYTYIGTALTPQTGRYRVTVSAYAVGTQGKPLTMAMICRPIRERGAQELRTCRDVPADKPTVFEAEFEMNRECHAWIAAWSLPGGYEFFLKKVPPPIEKYDGPGLVIEWLKIEGPIGPWPPESYQRVFKDVPLKARSVVKAEMEGRPIPKIPENRPESHWQNYDPLVPASPRPKEDAARLIRDFLPRALRCPVAKDLEEYYVKLVHDRLDNKYSFVDAMLHGYTAILSSTDFLFLQEPGAPELDEAKNFRSTRLDGYALASRLSYFLWSSLPDATLLDAARRGDLARPGVVREQVERMLNDPRARRFTENFTGQWLDLRKFNDTSPDPRLYGEYDAYLHWSLPRETELYFDEILKNNRSLLEFIDSDWSILNERLAGHYGIAGVEGQEMRKVKLPEGSHRGGVMTQGSVLKVTADGTRTSPVLRGKWVLERIVGKPPSPPPPDIPLFEPDIRGATTIREQLDKHRNTPACATCHNHIDPPGFALENFDAIGGWRDYYRAPKMTKRGLVKGQRYYRGPDVEVGGVTPDGRGFKNIDDYKRILLEDKDQLARNLTAKLLIYATGAEIQYADREVIEQIVANVRAKDYGFRELIHEIVQSRVFLHK